MSAVEISGRTAPDGHAASADEVRDTGLACLVMLAQFHSISAEPQKLSNEFCRDGETFGVVEILNAAKSLGLTAGRRSPSRARLELAPLPAIARSRNGHFFILARIDQGKVLIQDPGASTPEVLDLAGLYERWSGELIQIASRASLSGDLAKFDFSWFVPAVVKYRRALPERSAAMWSAQRGVRLADILPWRFRFCRWASGLRWNRG